MTVRLSTCVLGSGQARPKGGVVDASMSMMIMVIMVMVGDQRIRGVTWEEGGGWIYSGNRKCPGDVCLSGSPWDRCI
jgi:hypothetical protein